MFDAGWDEVAGDLPGSSCDDQGPCHLAPASPCQDFPATWIARANPGIARGNSEIAPGNSGIARGTTYICRIEIQSKLPKSKRNCISGPGKNLNRTVFMLYFVCISNPKRVDFV